MARDVAVKVLRLDTGLEAAEREEIQRRFEREAKAAGGLNHPNIVPVFSAGCEQGVPFYAMPLIKGR